MQMFRFREGPVLFGLFDHMFDTYPEVVERNNPEANVISRSPCVSVAKDYDITNFRGEKDVGQGTIWPD